MCKITLYKNFRHKLYITIIDALKMKKYYVILKYQVRRQKSLVRKFYRVRLENQITQYEASPLK